MLIKHKPYPHLTITLKCDPKDIERMEKGKITEIPATIHKIKETVFMYQVDRDKWEPTIVECHDGIEYGKRDVDGKLIKNDTHFLDKELAWDQLEIDARNHLAYLQATDCDEATKVLANEILQRILHRKE